MAQLKIDVIVDDNGAAQKLKQIESGVQGIESASAKAKNPIGEVVTALTSQSQASEKVVVSATKVEQASARQLKNLSAESAAWLNNTSAQMKASLGTDDLKKRYDVLDTKLQELNTTRAASTAAVGLEMAVIAALGTVAVAELKFLYESTKAYVTKSGILEQHADAIAEVKDAWQDLLFLAGQELVGSGANFNGWINTVSAGLRILGAVIAERISEFNKLLGIIGELKNIPGAMLGFGMGDSGTPTPANALRDVNGDLTAAGRMQQFFKNRDLLLAQRGADFGRPTGAQAQAVSDQADRERLAAQKAAQREAQAILDATRERRAQLSGQADIDFARQMMADVHSLDGGLMALSVKDLQKYNDALEAAADALQRQGRAITTSDPIFQEWLKSLNMHAVVGLGGKTFGTAAQLPSVTGFYGNTMPQAVQGLPGGLPGTSADLSNINPLKDVGFFQQAFGTGKQFGAQLGQAILGGIQGGWKGVISSIGSMFGGNIGNQLSEKFKDVGGVLGGLATMLGPLGSMLGGLVGKLGSGLAKLFGKGDDGDKERDVFLKEMGGFTALSERLHKELGSEGDSMFAAIRSANSGKEITAAADKIKDALEAHAAAIQDAMSTLPSAVNARAANITSQSDFSTVGAEAMGTFSFLVQQGQSAIQAFQAIAPAIGAMRQAFADNNFEMSAASQRLFELGQIIEQNKVQFDNIAASGSILSAMTQANIKDFELFKAAASDVGLNLQTIIDRGVPTAEALAMAQPQLQALWEAQQKFGYATDETTQALIDQAVQQGIVGEGMRDVNQRILDVLIAIGDVLGATIPDALRGLPAAANAAADGMNHAFGGVRPPSFMSRDDAQAWIDNPPDRDFTTMASTNASSGFSGGGGVSVYVDASGSLVNNDALSEQIAEAVAPYLPGAVESYGV